VIPSTDDISQGSIYIYLKFKRVSFINEIHIFNLGSCVPGVFVIKVVYFIWIWLILSGLLWLYRRKPEITNERENSRVVFMNGN